MNGYVEFHSPEGDPIVVNVDRVNFVRRYRGGNDASAVNFEKGNYVVVRGEPHDGAEGTARGIDRGSRYVVKVYSSPI